MTMNFDKCGWRDRNFQWLRKEKALWKGDKFAYRYMEMIGLSGVQMYQLLRPYLPSSLFFSGVDTDETIIMSHLLDKVPFPLTYGDIFAAALHMLQTKEGPKLGVLNCDTTNGIRPQWWDRKLEPLRRIVDLGTASCPKFCLILNHTLDRGGLPQTKTIDRLRTERDGILQVFTGWNLTTKDFAGMEVASQPGFAPRSEEEPTWAGPFEVYHSRNKTVRMVTLRMAFDRARKRITLDRP